MQNIPSRSFSAKLKCEVCLHYDEKCKECKDANAIQVKMSVVNLECATTSSSSEDEEEATSIIVDNLMARPRRQACGVRFAACYTKVVE